MPSQDLLAGMLHRVARCRKHNRDRACASHLRGQGVRVRIADLMRQRRLSHVHQLIAGGQNRDAKLPVHRHGRHPDGCEPCHRRVSDPNAAPDTRLRPHALHNQQR